MNKKIIGVVLIALVILVSMAYYSEDKAANFEKRECGIVITPENSFRSVVASHFQAIIRGEEPLHLELIGLRLSEGEFVTNKDVTWQKSNKRFSRISGMPEESEIRFSTGENLKNHLNGLEALKEGDYNAVIDCDKNEEIISCTIDVFPYEGGEKNGTFEGGAYPEFEEWLLEKAYEARGEAYGVISMVKQRNIVEKIAWAFGGGVEADCESVSASIEKGAGYYYLTGITENERVDIKYNEQYGDSFFDGTRTIQEHRASLTTMALENDESDDFWELDREAMLAEPDDEEACVQLRAYVKLNDLQRDATGYAQQALDWLSHEEDESVDSTIRFDFRNGTTISKNLSFGSSEVTLEISDEWKDYFKETSEGFTSIKSVGLYLSAFKPDCSECPARIVVG